MNAMQIKTSAIVGMSFALSSALIGLPLASGGTPTQLTGDQIADGWIALFDGETKYGWKSTNRDVNWKVVDGALQASEGPIGFLVTRTEFADYELHVEFRAAAGANGGVFLHTDAVPKDPATGCYEINVAPHDNPFPTGSLVSRQKVAAPNGPPAADQWHAFDLRVQKGEVEVRLNGRQCAKYKDPHPLRRGRIALQHNEGMISYRNSRLKPVGAKSMFNGQDLTGWNTDRAESSRFEVTDEGEMRVLDGRGQLESDGQYGDFALQLECRVDGDGLNSGVFFRCIPGDFMMGYECQIHNGMKEGDPTQPVDCGTGGIFRRQNARRIVARDREWFAITLIADGPHMAAWVDGVQVSNWIDKRKPHENPRKGLRLEPGTLAIQGHDPTTDLRFRNLQIQEFPARRIAAQ